MMILLVLDEVDQLESKDQAVLYTVFEWPALAGSKLALVGIGNSLDLTERVLPRLQVSATYTPTLLHFPPYTKQQIKEILTRRITAVEPDTELITPRALLFLAAKIAQQSGDIRRALDVSRQAFELVEKNSEVVDIVHILKALNAGSHTMMNRSVEGLPLLQKITLACLHLIWKKGGGKNEVTLARCESTLRNVLRKNKLGSEASCVGKHYI